jgi:hypothetical protein
MSEEWEPAKTSFTGRSHLGGRLLALPSSLVKAMPQRQVQHSGYEMQVSLTDAIMAGFFDPTVDGILELVERMVQRGGAQPAVMVLVGEFGSSPYLQLKMEGRFGGWHLGCCCPCHCIY